MTAIQEFRKLEQIQERAAAQQKKLLERHRKKLNLKEGDLVRWKGYPGVWRVYNEFSYPHLGLVETTSGDFRNNYHGEVLKLSRVN